MGRPRTFERPIVTCERCGKQYECNTRTTMGRYCSQHCRLNQVEKTCPQCGKVFSVRASKAAKYTYCSVACRHVANTSTVVCAHCSAPFVIPNARIGTARFCSKACADTHGQIIMQCLFCGQARQMKRYRVVREKARFCGNRCATLYRITHDPMPGYIGRKIREGRRTDIEAAVERVLLDLGIIYLFEHKVGRYVVDFALPSLGVALECDGWHHTTPKGKQHDAKKDAALTSEGWQVVRISGDEIHKDTRSAVVGALNL